MQLTHSLSGIKELFSKLRFSYLEQVTKEKFLRAIVGDPPQIVEPGENAALEAHLADTKQVLQAQKKEVEAMVAELDSRARDLSHRYETITLQTELLGTLPDQINGLSHTLKELRIRNRKNESEADERPEMNLPLDATREVVEGKKARLQEVEGQLKALRQSLPRQMRALEQEERETRLLEVERTRVINAAREAMERKMADGGIDEVEMRGRWLRGVESGMREMLEVKS